MDNETTWNLLRSGEVARGLAALQRACEEQPTPSHIMELGVAYLWSKLYEEAWEHFEHALNGSQNSLSNFYGMAGVAKWCLDQPKEAVRHWRDGLEAEYQDTAGLGLSLPLLLFAAAGLHPEIVSRAEVKALLTDKTADERIGTWPGPVVLWLLGQITFPQLERQCLADEEFEVNDRTWLANFFEGVQWNSEGRRSDFQTRMHNLSDTTKPAWRSSAFFLSRMWSGEFFMARHEALRKLD